MKAQQSGCAFLYQHYTSNSVPREYCGTLNDNLGDYDNEYSSMIIGPNTDCILAEHPRFAGAILKVNAASSEKYLDMTKQYKEIDLPPGKPLVFDRFGWDNYISSIACQPSGYFKQTHVNNRTVELFEHGWFAGEVSRMTLWQDGADIVSHSTIPGWDDKITSLRIGFLTKCTFYEHPHFRGSSIEFKWKSTPRENAAYPFLNPWWNDRISSFRCIKLPE